MIIFVDVDMDVSGGEPIRNRPGFGQWLTPERIKLVRRGFLFDEADRLSRDMLDYLKFAQDMAALEKIIVDVSDGTNTSTERGREALEHRILAAQSERQRIASRRRKAATRISNGGGWEAGRNLTGICRFANATTSAFARSRLSRDVKAGAWSRTPWKPRSSSGWFSGALTEKGSWLSPAS